MSAKIEKTPNFVRRMKLWGGFMVLLFAAWFGLWFYLADVADKKVTEQIAVSASDGIDLGCSNQQIKGFPFRIGLFCDQSSLFNKNTGVTLKAGALRTVAQMYKPGQMVLELDAPLSIVAADGRRTQVLWKLLHASVRLGLKAPKNVAVEVKKISIALPDVADGVLNAESGEFHARPNPDAPERDMDLALSFRQLSMSGGELISGIALNLKVDLLFKDGMSQLMENQNSGRPVLADGGEFELRKLLVSLPKGASSGALQMSGPLSVDAQGFVSGEVKISVSGVRQLSRQIDASFPAQTREGIKRVISMIEGFGIPGEIAGQPARGIIVSIDRGMMRAGFFPLGFIPPLEINR